MGQEAYSYVTCKTLAPMLRKRELGFPLANTKCPPGSVLGCPI